MAADKERDPGSSSAEIGKYLDILAKDPNSRVFAPLAEAYRKAGFLEDAVETALEGLKVHPNYLGGRVALGRAYFEKKQYAEAAAEMQKVAKAAPDNIIAHKVLGQIADCQGDLPAAQKAFKMVLLLDPRDHEAQEFISSYGGGTPAAAAPAPVQSPPIAVAPPPPPPPPPPHTIPVFAPVAARPVAPPQAPPPAAAPAAAPLPFDEIQSIDDLDLQADDIFGAPDQPAPPAAPVMPVMPVTPAEAMVLQGFESEEPLDIAPDSWLPDLKSAAVAEEPLQAPSAPEPPAAAPARPTEPPPSDGMELEVFSRMPWRADTTLPLSPPPPATPATPAVVAGEEPESPFVVFGRPMRGGPPQSTKGEQTAFGDIDLESTAYEPVQSEPEADTDSPFEMFTRQPGPGTPQAPAKAERGVGTESRELDIETTAYTPPDTFTPGDLDASPLSLDEELPRIDLTQEMDFGAPDDSMPSPAEPEPEPELELELEPELEPEPGVDLALDLGSDLAPDMELDLGSDLEVDLGSEEAALLAPQSPEMAVPTEPAQKTPLDTLEEEYAEEFEEVAPEPEPPGAEAGRGVFDTETLDSIYVNQGFYGRAAEIYQRLVAQRPDDMGLRRKLEDVLAQERAEAGIEEPVAAAAAAAAQVPTVSPALAEPAQVEPPAAAPAGSELVIGRLQTLLDTFKEGRPR